MRIVLGLLPIAAMVAGAAPEIVSLFFGLRFEPAASLLAVLIFGAVAFVMISVAMAIVTAAGEPRLTLVLSAPLVPLAVVGHLVLIPRFGSLGAAFVTTLCAGLGALACVLVVYRLWSILPPIGTLGRSALVSVLAYVLALLWPAAGLLVLVKLAVIGVVIVLTYLVLREFSAEEIALARSFLGWAAAPTQRPHGA
jgi:O-antigen/teichoic acid export membrane protein